MTIRPLNLSGHGLWPLVLGQDQLLRHQLVMGTTGSGKTEYLLRLAEQQVIHGGGLLLVDGKGERPLVNRLAGILHEAGRLDDYFVLDFGEDAPTNRFNALATATSDDVTEFMVQMMDNPGHMDVWKARSMALLRGVVACAVDMRGPDFVPDYARLRRMLNLNNLVFLVTGKRMEGEEAHAPTERIRPESMARLRAYLDALPGFRWTRSNSPHRLSGEAVAQHGYLLSNLFRVMDDLVHTFGHCFGDGPGDIDMIDIMDRHRVMLVLLPSLSRSPEVVRALGRLVLGALRGAMRVRLKSGPPTTDIPANLVIMDEVGAYAMPGLDMMAAQARSLRLGMVFATQTLSSLQHAGKELSENILGNCGTKIFLRCEDAFATSELARKISPIIAEVTHQQVRRNLFSFHDWATTGIAKLEPKSQLDYRALCHLRPGEGYLIRGVGFRKMRFARAKSKPMPFSPMRHGMLHGFQSPGL